MTVLRERGIRRLVILDAHGRLTGIITQSDLLRAHAEELSAQNRSLEQRVAERTRDLSQLNTRLESLARVDALLEIGNRRAMDEELDRVEQRLLRYRRPYAVALLDVDHFKAFNDLHGHAAGDDALCRITAAIGDCIRSADALFRYGGEEFLIVFPEVGEEGATVAAEHVRDAVAALRIPQAASPRGQVTVSLSVAAEHPEDACWRRLVARADEALHAAKGSGHDRVVCAGKSDAAGIAQHRRASVRGQGVVALAAGS